MATATNSRVDLSNERPHHMLALLDKKDALREKKDEVEAFFKRYF